MPPSHSALNNSSFPLLWRSRNLNTVLKTQTTRTHAWKSKTTTHAPTKLYFKIRCSALTIPTFYMRYTTLKITTSRSSCTLECRKRLRTWKLLLRREVTVADVVLRVAQRATKTSEIKDRFHLSWRTNAISKPVHTNRSSLCLDFQNKKAAVKSWNIN